jgi:hypothetical protein
MSLKYYFFAKYKFPTYPHFFYKNKKMKDERKKRVIYIKIINKEPLLVPYTLGNTGVTFEG